uniref:Peptidase S1 domain-containing protein n=1 Tax=Panagrolaimus davidi TaxID=227884 RepID=A0A914PDH9_9BILA
MFNIFLVFLLVFSFVSSYPIENNQTIVECGISPALNRYGNILNNDNRIMGGVISPPQFWPWLAALKTSRPGCSAEIIGKRWILTAAHCENVITDGGFIIAGTTDENEINEKTKYDILKHYLPVNSSSDIMIIELSRDLEYSENVSPICISKTFLPSEGDNAIVAGFGLLFIEYDPYSNTGVDGVPTNLLHEGIVEIKNLTECEKITETIDGVICAGGINRGVMSGDSGGPIMGIKDNKFYLFGEVHGGAAFETEANDPLTVNEIDSYTTVSLHCDWIEEITKGDVKCEN